MSFEDEAPSWAASSGMFKALLARRDPDDVLAQLRAACRPESLRSLFQPIYRASSGELEGCEALIRFPKETGFATPFEAFIAAGEHDLLLDLESACILRHLGEAKGFCRDLWIFVNVSAPLFTDPRFGAPWLLERTAAAGLSPGQVILEVPEIVRIRDFPAFSGHLAPFRSAGFRIAIDDFGAGYTNLRMIVELSPDFVKIDRIFVDDIASHSRKKVLVESVVSLCHRINCRVIAEGIELPGDLETCLGAGVDFLQGFLFARPLPAQEAFSSPGLAMPAMPLVRTLDDVRHLVLVVEPVEGSAPIAAACERFVLDPRLTALPVVRNGRPVALLRRESAAARMREKGQDGTTFDERTDTENGFDRVAELASVEEAAALFLRRDGDHRFEPLVAIGPDQTYRGLLRPEDLMAELMRLKVDYSLQSNPVTQLPGRIVYERTLAQRLARRLPVAVGRVNVRRFKLYNDRYGFSRGDELLITLASLLKESLAPDPGAFIAHMSGDDFAFATSFDRAEPSARYLLASFAEKTAELHDPDDVAASGFSVRDRRGEMLKVPLVTLAVGLVRWDGEAEVSLRTLMETAEEVLVGAKRDDGGGLLFNRRSLSSRPRPSASSSSAVTDRLPRVTRVS
jgi:EAL domain-containing protein (putative c-di-GMP-specific phosphodiesterase class I)/GGDEF domain-containing protein